MVLESLYFSKNNHSMFFQFQFLIFFLILILTVNVITIVPLWFIQLNGLTFLPFPSFKNSCFLLQTSYLTRIRTYLFFTFVLPSVFNDIFTFLLCFTSSNRRTTHFKKQNMNLGSTRGITICTGLHVCLHHRKIY